VAYAGISSFHSRRGVSKAALVYEDLLIAIIRLRLKPGARIDKLEVCGRLGVSRQPLAEAVARLADERLIVVEPQKGTFVARIRLTDVVEAAFLRRALETATVAAIARDIDDIALEQLERIHRHQTLAAKTSDTEEFYALDLRFHGALFDRMAMPRVAEVIGSSRAQLERARRLLLPTPGRTQNTLREHHAIVAALRSRDPVAAAGAMGDHLDEAMVELRRFAARQPDLFE
jgi:DNA-binding GntR family transcriptional regulator